MSSVTNGGTGNLHGQPALKVVSQSHQQSSAPPPFQDNIARSETSPSSHSLEKERTLNASYNSKGWGPYGGNPLALVHTEDGIQLLPAFGGEFQPGLYRPQRKFGNPTPMGLAGFALTTFLLSLINLGTRGLSSIEMVVGPTYAYGGLVQLLAGMWEMAVGNTFGATALASYGGFWISLGIIFTPGGFNIVSSYGGQTAEFSNAFGLYLIGWFIFTFILWLCTLRSTIPLSSLILFVWLTFLLLGLAYLDNASGAANVPLTRAGGATGIIASFIAWYIVWAGIADSTNSFFVVPVLHFPWSATARQQRQERENSKAE